MIRFEHVGLRYGVGPEVLSDVDFTLEAGSFHFLSGASGAGKSSLLSLLYLGRRPTRGLVTMFGQQVMGMKRAHLPALRREIGVVFQDYRLMAHLSAFDNVALPLRIRREPEKNVQTHVRDLLEWVGLGDHQRALPETLSGGQKQRVAIARAVVTQPRLLLADEPTGNLDEPTSVRLMGLFEQLNKRGTTLVIATHNTALMEQFGHTRLRLHQGHLTPESAA